MSSTTIRYSGVPENSHSGDLTNPADDHTIGHTYGRTIDYTATDPAALRECADGYYDWAGRRLFLSDGSPDPLTPGAYRYQASPDYCDLEAAESDPASPRYEPPQLRHQPGDTWLIDRDRPYDPDDPGPFGSPGWRPDPRTGRHRRNELPDPIPPWEQSRASIREHQDEPAPVRDRRGESEPVRDRQGESAVRDRQGESAPVRDRRGESTPVRDRRDEPAPARNHHDDTESGPQPQAGGGVPPWRPRRHILRGSPEPAEPQQDPNRSPDSRPSRPTPAPGRPSPAPRDRSRFWSESDRNAEAAQAHAPDQASGQARTAADPPDIFEKLREDAWARFIEKSEPLAAASRANLSALERECGWQIALWVRFFRWLVALLRSLGNSPDAVPDSASDSAPGSTAGTPGPGPDSPQSQGAHPGSAGVQGDQRPSTAQQRVPVQRREGWRAGRSVIAPDRHTHLAYRTARFAQAMRGAQRAQANRAAQVTARVTTRVATGVAAGGAAWA